MSSNFSFYDKPGFIWLDGQFLPWKDSKLHVLTHALHYGSAVYEGCRAYNGRVFKLNEHIQRLHKSAEFLGYKIPYSVKILNQATKKLLFKNNLQEAYVRPIAWYDVDSLSLGAKAEQVHVAIAAWVWKSYFKLDDKFEKGLKLTWADWVRPAPNMSPYQAKAAGLYVISTLSKRSAEQKEFNDALMLDYRGYIAECTGANVFFVKNGDLHTPIPDCFLNGITRQTIIEIAKKMSINVIERYIKPEEVNDMDEMFLTGTAAEITPVTQIGETKVPIGPISKKIAKAYEILVRNCPCPEK